MWAARSFQVRLEDSIRAIFFLRSQPLIYFSRAANAKAAAPTRSQAQGKSAALQWANGNG
jgi:hypothetical protein